MWSHILNHLIMSLSGQHFFEWFSFSDVFLRTSFSELKPFWDLLNSLNRCWFPLPLYTLFSWGQWPCHLCMWLCPLLPQEIICGFDPWVKKIPWSRKWQLTPVFLLGNPMDRGAWWATVHGVIRSRTRLVWVTYTTNVTELTIEEHEFEVRWLSVWILDPVTGLLSSHREQLPPTGSPCFIC